MRLSLVQDLLQLITELDRAPFPEGAAVSWLPIMDGIDYNDARQAVLEHYASSTARDSRGRERRILPVDVRSRAIAIAENRMRAARRALGPPPGRVGSTGRPAHVLAELAAARLRAQEALDKHRQTVAA